MHAQSIHIEMFNTLNTHMMWNLLVYIHTYIHTCIHTHIHIYIHTYICVTSLVIDIIGKKNMD